MYVMVIATHSPENCAMVNEAAREATLAAIGQMDTLAAKHGVKPAGFWDDLGGHVTYGIFDTPSLDACWALLDNRR